MVVGVQIAGPVGEQLPYPGDFRLVFREVGLQVEIRVGGIQGPGHGQLFRGGSGGEAGGEGVAQTVSTMPALDQVPAIPFRIGRRVLEIVRAVPIHHHLAAKHAQTAPGGGLEKGVSGTGMDRGEHGSGGGAVGQEPIQHKFGAPFRHLRIGKLGLRREGVVVEPVQQLATKGGDDSGLGVMEVGIHQSGENQPPLVIQAPGPVRHGHGGQHLVPVVGQTDPAILNPQAPVLMPAIGVLSVFRPGVGKEIEQTAPHQQGGGGGGGGRESHGGLGVLKGWVMGPGPGRGQPLRTAPSPGPGVGFRLPPVTGRRVGCVLPPAGAVPGAPIPPPRPAPCR